MPDQEPTIPDLDTPEVLNPDDQLRIEGIHLLSRTLAHHVNNDLSPAVGILDLLKDMGAIPTNLLPMVDDALEGITNVSKVAAKAMRTRRLVTEPSPQGPLLNLDASSSPNPTPKK